MTTKELIEKLKEVDPDGKCEVILNVWHETAPVEEVKNKSWFDEDDDTGEIIAYYEIELS